MAEMVLSQSISIILLILSLPPGFRGFQILFVMNNRISADQFQDRQRTIDQGDGERVAQIVIVA